MSDFPMVWTRGFQLVANNGGQRPIDFSETRKKTIDDYSLMLACDVKISLSVIQITTSKI